MGLLRLLAAPVAAPLTSALWVSRKIHEAADAEMNDPATLRRRLAALEAQLDAGEIEEAAYDAAEREILLRLQRAHP